MSDCILVGTRKGTFAVVKRQANWHPKLVGHAGTSVNYVTRDPNSGNLWAALGFGHWGAKLSRSADEGATWTDTTQIKYPAEAKYLSPPFPDETTGDVTGAVVTKEAIVLKLWKIGFGAPGQIYVGTIPGGLFESQDDGETFALNMPLWNHESRGGDLNNGGSGETHWFGTPASEGGDFAPGLHSVEVHPQDPKRILVAVSTAGVLGTRDGGKTWQGCNKGMLNDYLPDPAAEWGHDAHYIEMCPGDPDHVWQQNHAGIFYSRDGAETWKRVSTPGEKIHFGFPVAADDEKGPTAWVVPGHSDMKRMAIDGGLFVARTEDGGENWEELREGLPQQGAYDVVLRHSLSQHAGRLAFGSTTGNLYVSEDRGETWQTAANNLPPIYSVRFG